MVVYSDGTGDSIALDTLSSLWYCTVVTVPITWPTAAMPLARFLPLTSTNFDIVVTMDADDCLNENMVTAINAWISSTHAVMIRPYPDNFKNPHKVYALANFLGMGPSRDHKHILGSLTSWVSNPAALEDFHRDEMWLHSYIPQLPKPFFACELLSNKTSAANKGNLVKQLKKLGFPEESKRDTHKPRDYSPTGKHVESFYGYCQKTDKYRVRFTDCNFTMLVSRGDLVETDPRWFSIAERYGIPRMGPTGGWRPLLGALTRAQTVKVATDSGGIGPLVAGSTLGSVAFQCPGEYRCLLVSFLNLTQGKLSLDEQRMLEVSAIIEQGGLSDLLSREAWPVRIRGTTVGTSLPSEPGNYLVYFSKAHCDALRIGLEGNIHFFASDPRVSTKVLSEVPIACYTDGQTFTYNIIEEPPKATNYKRAASRNKSRASKKKTPKPNIDSNTGRH